MALEGNLRPSNTAASNLAIVNALLIKDPLRDLIRVKDKLSYLIDFIDADLAEIFNIK